MILPATPHGPLSGGSPLPPKGRRMAEIEIEGPGGARFKVTPGLDPAYVEHYERQKSNGEIREVKPQSSRKPKAD